MVQITINTDPRIKRAIESLALRRGESLDDLLQPHLKGIANQAGLDLSLNDADQEEAVSRAESDARKAESRRVEAAAERSRLAAESEKPKTTTAKN